MTFKETLPYDCKVAIDDLAREINPGWEVDDWFSWPPDVFALTSIWLQTTGAYRYAVSRHPDTNDFLPHAWRDPKGRDAEAVGGKWVDWILSIEPDLPDDVAEIKKALFDPSDGRESDNWEFCETICVAVLRLHGYADAACRGLGLSHNPSGRKGIWFFAANFLLEASGTLSRLSKRYGLVLPKMRTPQSGLSYRSFSHHLTFHKSEVKVNWRSIPWVNKDERVVNILAIPMPYKVNSLSFRRCHYPGQHGDINGYSYFQFEPSQDEKFDIQTVMSLLEESSKEVDRVHLLVFPELALTVSDLSSLKMALEKRGKGISQKIPMIITGVRDKSDGNVGKNQVVLSVFFVGRWYDLSQDKHHRWKLDSRQIKQYSLSLDPRTQWWEGIDVPRRHLTFLAPNDWLTLCPLICEDLAQLEPISDLIRGVGPTLVIAILMDGPQLLDRWSARYVSVLADDPGTSILTLTSLGMATRSRAPGKPESRTIALWKDQETGAEQIELKHDADAVLLTISAKWVEEFTADLRGDNSKASVFVLQGVSQLRARKGPQEIPPGSAGKSRRKKKLEESDIGKELTVYLYLIDAILDAPIYVVKELRNYVIAVGEAGSLKALIDNPSTERLHKEFKPFEKLTDCIKVALERNFQGGWPGPDLAYAVIQSCWFLESVHSKLSEAMRADRQANIISEDESKLRLWSSIVREARISLSNINESKAIRESPEAQKIKSKQNRSRLNRVVYISILLAIQDRVQDFKDKKNGEDVDRVREGINRECKNILSDIESCIREF
jgi:hypothetical protein